MKKSTIRLLFIVTVAAAAFLGTMAIFSAGATSANEMADEAKLYAKNCGACHPQGGNIIIPALPVKGSAKMKNLEIFSAYNRNPLKADGSKGAMPPFPKEKISDEEMKLIYEYALTLPGTKK